MNIHWNENEILTRRQILHIVRALAGHVDLKAAIKSVSVELQSVVEHDHFDAALFTEDRDKTIVYETGLKTSWGSENGLNAISPIREILSGKTDYLITSNAMEDPRMSGPGINAAPIREFGLKSRVHARIEIGGELIGALSLSSKKPDLYSDVHIKAALMIADIVGPYLHALRQSELAKRSEVQRAKDRADALGFQRGARLLTEQLERERERLGMDLHDQTLAELTRMIRALDDPNTNADDKLDKMRFELVSSAKELRNIIDNAKPTLLHLFGLVEAVDAFLENSLQQSKISWKIETDKQACKQVKRYSDIVVLSTFRIIQEAINNVAKHAGATQVVVSFLRDNDTICVQIEDNGKGISHTDSDSPGGIENMTTRATLIGAELELSARAPQTGTTVRLLLPQPEKKMEMDECHA